MRSYSSQVATVILWLDAVDMPIEGTVREAQTRLRDHRFYARNAVVVAAVRRRKERPKSD